MTVLWASNRTQYMNDTEPATNTVTEYAPPSKRFRRGDIREDGKIFWRYGRVNCREVESWLSPERFDNWLSNLSVNRSPEERRAARCAHARRWQRDNAEKRRAYMRAYMRRRIAEDPVEAMRARVRGRLKEALKGRGAKKKVRSSRMLGCSWKELARRIESRFAPGMSWENRSEWHIDHIVPLALARTPKDVEDLSHYTNLRPLWARDNRLKSAKPPPPEECPAHLLRFVEQVPAKTL